MKIKEIYEEMNHWAPFETAEDFDNCGLIIGDFDAEITKIGFALDITQTVIDQALDAKINLIITHHPPIFHAIKQIHAPSPVYRLIQNGISVISAHTNLDKAKGGVNDILAEYYCLHDIISPEILSDLGRIGTLDSPTPIPEYAEMIKKRMNAQGIRYLDCGKPAHKVAYISGGGGGQFHEAMQCGADTFITGDIKHDQFVDAQNAGLNLIEAGHFDSENLVYQAVANHISAFSGLDVLLLSAENPVQSI